MPGSYIPSMQTALHIMALAAELRQEIVGGTITATEFYKKERAAYLIIKKDRSRRAFGLVYHPGGFGAFLVPASKIEISTAEKPRPFFKVEGAVVTRVEQLGFDRICRIDLEKDGRAMSIVVEALGPNANLWLLDEQRARAASLRKRTFTAGDEYQARPLPDKLNPKELSVEALLHRLEYEPKAASLSPGFIEKNILGFDRTLAQEVIVRSEVDASGARGHAGGSLETVVGCIRKTVAHFERPQKGYLYRLEDGAAVYPFRLTSVERQPERFKSLSLAVLAGINLRRKRTEAAVERKAVENAVTRAGKRLRVRLAKIKRDIEEASNHEQHKKIGELLQISFARLKKGMTRIVVEDVYVRPGTEMTIPLEPSLSPSENIEACFKKYRKGRQGLQLLQRRLVVTQQELARLEMIRSELQEDFESARRRYDPELANLLPRKATRADTESRLPYREYTLATGVRIFVGRDGADNDRTTFGFARPYELWFHAQQCPGSHVVMKFPNKSFEPSKLEIEQAAAVAAYFSKAKKDSLVPIIYTYRRYVRKPRKAAPGSVAVEREKSLMVAPRKPLSARR